MSAREQLHAALSLLGRTTDAHRLVADRDAELLNQAADFLKEIGTPITGERSEHERGVMYASERLRRLVDERDGGKDTGVSSTIPATAGESTRSARPCPVSGCGSGAGFLDLLLESRRTWTEVRQNSSTSTDSLWYHSPACAAAALAPAAAPVRQCVACGCTCTAVTA